MQINQQVYFSIVPEWLTESKVTDNAFRVYATLCRYADKEDGSCYPSIKSIGNRCGKSPSSVKRALKELKEIGAIKVEARYIDDGQTSNLYTVIFNPTIYGMGAKVINEQGVSPNMDHKLKSSNQSHIIQEDKSGRKYLFNALSNALEYTPKTKQEISGFNKVIKDIAEIGGTSEEIEQRVYVYKTKWKDITITPFAIAKNWTLLGQMVEDNKPPEVYNCEEKGHKWVDLDVIFHCRMCKKEKSKD